MANSTERIVAAAVEGQAQDLRFIQGQLSKLHAALVRSSLEIQAAIQRDTKCSASEAEIQYALTLENLASHFSNADFEAALHNEYNIARGENRPNGLAPHGIVYIVPSSYNAVYSSIAASAAAIAAGNCIIFEVSVQH